jgi:ElaB/YqjD/DUF883 family membrane-anchored ribosome-binding protein
MLNAWKYVALESGHSEKSMENVEHSRTRLAEELHAVRSDIDHLVKALKSDSTDLAGDARVVLRRARSRIESTKAGAMGRARSSWYGVDGFAHGHPWRTAAVAVGAGLVIGALAGLLMPRH